MKIHGNQGKEEDEPKVVAAAEAIKCSVCTTLVEDLWNKTAGIDYDPGETGRCVHRLRVQRSTHWLTFRGADCGMAQGRDDRGQRPCNDRRHVSRTRTPVHPAA
jgi:hypothetical protein|eukprot:COSAG02_NODE_10771_length_1861_cov_8.138776_2_plen_104_part_00